MKLFKADFVRNFAIGFALGAAVVFGALGQGSINPMVGEAVARTAE